MYIQLLHFNNQHPQRFRVQKTVKTAVLHAQIAGWAWPRRRSLGYALCCTRMLSKHQARQRRRCILVCCSASPPGTPRPGAARPPGSSLLWRGRLQRGTRQAHPHLAIMYKAARQEGSDYIHQVSGIAKSCKGHPSWQLACTLHACKVC